MRSRVARTDVALLLGQAGVVGRDEDALDLVELVDDRAVGAQQPERLVDDALEQVARLADRGDPGGDLAQRLLRLGASLDDRARAGELLDQARVADRDRGLGGERGQDLAVGVVVGATWRETTDSVPIGPGRRPASGTAIDRADARCDSTNACAASSWTNRSSAR